MGRKVLVVVAVALVAAASWFAWRYPSAPAIETPAEVASSGEGQGNDAGEALGASVATGPGDATGDAAAAGHDADKEPGVEPDLATAFYAARSAREAWAVIERGRAAGLPEANDAMLELDGICAPGISAPEGQAWVDEWLAGYCEGYVPLGRGQGAAEHARLQAVAASEASTRALKSMLHEVEPGERGPLVLDALGAARNPYDVRATLQLAAEERIAPRPLRQAHGVDDLALRDTLNLASEIVFCRLTRGCGPGSIPAVSGCLMTGICQQGLGMEDIYRQSVSPVMFNNADALANELISGRRPRE